MYIKVYVLFSFTLLSVMASDIMNLRKKFNERVDAVINKTIVECSVESTQPGQVSLLIAPNFSAMWEGQGRTL